MCYISLLLVWGVLWLTTAFDSTALRSHDSKSIIQDRTCVRWVLLRETDKGGEKGQRPAIYVYLSFSFRLNWFKTYYNQIAIWTQHVIFTSDPTSVYLLVTSGAQIYGIKTEYEWSCLRNFGKRGLWCTLSDIREFLKTTHSLKEPVRVQF